MSQETSENTQDRTAGKFKSQSKKQSMKEDENEIKLDNEFGNIIRELFELIDKCFSKTTKIDRLSKENLKEIIFTENKDSIKKLEVKLAEWDAEAQKNNKSSYIKNRLAFIYDVMLYQDEENLDIYLGVMNNLKYIEQKILTDLENSPDKRQKLEDLLEQDCPIPQTFKSGNSPEQLVNNETL